MDRHPMASMTGSTSPEVIASRYRLDDWLGAGGMAEVFVATDLVLGRLVAVKRLPSAAVVDAIARARFAREARALARVNHPNVVTVFDAIEGDGRPFLVMELVDGTTLRDALDQAGLPAMRTVVIASGIAAGLAAVHAQGIVHRDLKPSNVFLTASGAVKIGDFGIARIATDPALTRTGEMFGSAPYIAPEQVDGGAVDGRADLYSLGCVMFEMLAGRPPFEGDDPLSLTYQHLHAEPTPIDALVPGLPDGLASIVHGLLSKAPEDRPQTADQVGLALAGIPVVAPTAAPDVVPEVAPDVPSGVAASAPTTPLVRAPTTVLPPRRADARRQHRRLATWVPWAAFVAITITVLLVLSAMTGARERGASSNPSTSRPPASSQGSPLASATPVSPTPVSTSATLPPAGSLAEAAAVLEEMVQQMESVGAVDGDLAKGLEHGAEDVVKDLEHGDTQGAYDVINGMRDGLASAVELGAVSPEDGQRLQAAIDQLAGMVGPVGSSGNQGGGDEGGD